MGRKKKIKPIKARKVLKKVTKKDKKIIRDILPDDEFDNSADPVLEEDDGSPEVKLVDISEDDEIINEKEVVNDTKDTLSSIEDAEVFSLASVDEGEGQLETIRANPKPKLGWADKVKPLFSPGDLVVPIELSKKEAKEVEPYKIVGPHVEMESYFVKKSRILAESVMFSDELQLAPKGGLPFVSHWDATDPFKVKGVNISCPSNSKK
jgi:hypothetical protein